MKERGKEEGLIRLEVDKVYFNRKMVERLRESISLSELIQEWNVVALKQRVLFNIK